MWNREITLAAAETGCEMVGIDPYRPSLKAAQAKPGAHRVRWIKGTSSAILAGASFDVAIISANVVQAILEDTELAE